MIFPSFCLLSVTAAGCRVCNHVVFFTSCCWLWLHTSALNISLSQNLIEMPSYQRVAFVCWCRQRWGGGCDPPAKWGRRRLRSTLLQNHFQVHEGPDELRGEENFAGWVAGSISSKWTNDYSIRNVNWLSKLIGICNFVHILYAEW